MVMSEGYDYEKISFNTEKESLDFIEACKEKIKKEEIKKEYIEVK